MFNPTITEFNTWAQTRKMKLKNRIAVTGSLFVVMSTIFLVGVQLGLNPEGTPKTEPVKERTASPRAELPKIAGVADHKVSERMKNLGIPERKVGVDSVMALHNRSLPVVPRGPPRFDESKLLDHARNLGNFGKELVTQRIQGKEIGAVHHELNRFPELNKTPLKSTDKEHRFQIPSELVKVNPPRKPDNQSPSLGQESDPWNIWESWVQQDSFYPEGSLFSDEMNSILRAMATQPIKSFDVGHRGTQLKATVFLGRQKAVFKPMRYARSEVITGNPYAGFDRHNAEIAGFHLDGLLGFQIAPPVVGRRINLTALWPVTSSALRETFFQDEGGNTCFYGKCYYCKREEAACANREVMEGSVTLWLSEWYTLKTRRHPYQRTYRPDKKAKWETSGSYCNTTIMTPSSQYYYGILEFTDSSIYDFLMGNADRHHYETYSKAKRHGKLLHIDNGKSFGNPNHDEVSILAPLIQCCRVRESTWLRIEELLQSEKTLSQQLQESMSRDPIFPILTTEHLAAVNRRLGIAASAVRECIRKQGRDTVIVSSWPVH